MPFIFRVEYDVMHNDHRAVLFRNLPGGDREAFFLTSERVGPVVPARLFHQPSDFHSSCENLLRAIVDGCARAGIVPGDMGGVLAAKDRHLADLRALAFGGLKIEAPR